jgi:N-acetylmuramoyl-L-alanine amidase
MNQERIERRTILAAGTAALAATLLTPGTEVAAAPTGDARLQTIPLAMLDRRAVSKSEWVLLPEHTTKPFSLFGITWADPTAAVSPTVQVRTRARATGQWSAWQTPTSHGSTPHDARGATDPLWVGQSDGVQARLLGGGHPPDDLRIDLINPGEPPAAARLRPEPAPAARQAPSRGTVPVPTRPVPHMITRVGWGADETIVKAAPAYTGPTEVFFVHHTATGNGYNCADSAAIVRGIQAYQVRSKGWDDIGYNFLVDKCGHIFEGRGGGVGRSVLGAHTMGFNTDASAIAVIGTYDAVRVSPTVERAIATVAAYKLGAYRNAPAGRVRLTSGGGNLYPQGANAYLYRISGHRDAGRTDCPGDALYTQLPAIRAIAGAGPAGLRFLHMTGALKSGSRLYTKGAIKPLWNVATPSALIDRFEIWIDGRLALAVPGSHRTALLHLHRGRHTIAIRAVHLSGRTSTVATEIVADATASVFTPPRHRTRRSAHRVLPATGT